MKTTPVIKVLNIICVVAFLGFSHGIINKVFGQSQNLGDYNVQLLPDWNYSGDKSAGDFYVFLNSQQKIEVAFKKEPTPCLNPMEFTKLILPIIQSFQKDQWIIEQRKPAVPYSFAGQKSCHFMKLKSRATGQQKFVLNPLVKTKMYQIEITSETPLTEPPAEAINFISLVSTSDSPATVAKKNANQPDIASNNTNEPESKDKPDDDLSGFTKVKAPEPAPQKPKPATSDAKPENQTTQPETTPTTESSSNTVTGPSQSAPGNYNVEKGNVPNVKFSVTDPCAAGGNTDGLPWENKKLTTKIELPKGIEAAQVPIIPNLKSLSEVSYNASVSTAFEAMRLVYGSMPDDEAKKFEAAWTPLFDFPSQEIIDYLNKLNPLVSQFLACRESYVRSLTDIQSILLDASIAIELKEQYAWEAAMAGAGLSSSGLQPLEAAMKQLAQQIETLGNPPNPNTAKCDARNRYKKALGQPVAEFPFEGEWTDNNGIKSLIKTIYGYPDGKALVYIYPITWVKEQESKGFNMSIMGPQTATDGSSTLSLPGIADMTYVFGEIKEGVWIAKALVGFGEINAYFTNGDRMNTHSYIPPGNMASTRLTVTNSTKTNVCPDKPPVFPTYKKSWDEFVQEFSNTANIALEEYMKWSKAADASIQIAVEGSLEKQKRREEYETKRRGAGIHYQYATGREYGSSESEQKAKVTDREKAKVEYEANLQKLEEEYSDIVTPGNKEVKKPEAKAPEKPDDAAAKKNEAELAEQQRAEQVRKDAIAVHSELAQFESKNLEREIADRDLAIKELPKAKTPKEAKYQEDRIKEFNLRIINISSNVQYEQDMVDSYETGEVVHTRSAFDEYARSKFVNDVKENAARVDATRRIAQQMDRLIDLLPEEIRAAARESARKILDGKTIASGDIEKARKFANSISNQVQGYAEYDKAQAEEADVDAQQNEFYAQTTIMAAGAVFMGLGSAALAETFGAEAALTIYGTKTLGAVWGGTTGLIAGGPKEGIAQAVSWWSPNGYAAVQFIEGYQHAGYQPNATTATKVWNGVQQAGTAMFLGKVFEMGTGLIAKGSLVAFGNESRLFKPIVQTSSQRSKNVLDAMRTTQRLENAKDEIKTFQKLEAELAILKRDPIANPQKIAQQEAQLKQLAAGLNASYYAKWQLKYKADPLVRSKFDRRVQDNYSEMTPGMVKRLEQQGYNMDGIEFKQFRNASSGGTSSMDLDLGPVLKGTMQEPGIKMFSNKMVVKKDGSIVTMEQFMNDGQKAMNAEYKQLFGITAPSSDMNLVSSVHKESFLTTKLLDKNVDFSTITPEELASIGKVLDVKMSGIANNNMLTNTTKMQAQCRESSKEIENMLLKKLQQDLAKAPAGSVKQKEIQKDITYWENMLKRFKQIGTEETNPMKIIELNREIMRETGGKDATGVINDLTYAFRKK